MAETPRLREISQICRMGPSLAEHLQVELPADQEPPLEHLVLTILTANELRFLSGVRQHLEGTSPMTRASDVMGSRKPNLSYFVNRLGVHEHDGIHTLYGAASQGSSRMMKKEHNAFYGGYGVENQDFYDKRTGLGGSGDERIAVKKRAGGLQVHRLALAHFADETHAAEALARVQRKKDEGDFPPIPFGAVDFMLKHGS